MALRLQRYLRKRLSIITINPRIIVRIVVKSYTLMAGRCLTLGDVSFVLNLVLQYTQTSTEKEKEKNLIMSA